MKQATKIFKRAVFILMLLGAVFLWSFQQYSVDDAPGPLSPAHKDSPGLKNCGQCHNNDLEVVPQKCLSCHQELAARISANRGFHKEKTEDCAVCHTEHEGDDTKLVDMDVEDFDHEETGYPLLGKHSTVTDCLICHKRENSIPRKITFSYIMKDSRCLSCHEPQHPGQQDNCQICHTQNNWRVEIWGMRTK
jgi:predicted CXXCH cytochrome family protein